MNTDIAHIESPSTGLLDDLVSIWEFEETTGTTAFDSQGSNDLNNTNCTINQTGKINQCYLHNGTTSFLSHSTLLDTMPSALTLAAWVRRTSNATAGGIFNKNNISGQDRMFAYVNTSGQLRFDYEEHNNGLNGNNAGAFSLNTFHLVVFIWGPVGGVQVYLDNVRTVNLTGATTLMANGTFTDFWVGRQGSSGAVHNAWENLLDEAVYWNAEKPASQLTSLWNGGAGLPFSSW